MSSLPFLIKSGKHCHKNWNTFKEDRIRSNTEAWFLTPCQILDVIKFHYMLFHTHTSTFHIYISSNRFWKCTETAETRRLILWISFSLREYENSHSTSVTMATRSVPNISSTQHLTRVQWGWAVSGCMCSLARRNHHVNNASFCVRGVKAFYVFSSALAEPWTRRHRGYKTQSSIRQFCCHRALNLNTDEKPEGSTSLQELLRFS